MRILVELEEPKACEQCPFCYETEGAFIDACQHPNGGDFSVPGFDIRKDRPRWCPFNRAEDATLGQEVSVGRMTQTMEQDCKWVPLEG